jgi:hypothetical protein
LARGDIAWRRNQGFWRFLNSGLRLCHWPLSRRDIIAKLRVSRRPGDDGNQ